MDFHAEDAGPSERAVRRGADGSHRGAGQDVPSSTGGVLLARSPSRGASKMRQYGAGSVDLGAKFPTGGEQDVPVGTGGVRVQGVPGHGHGGSIQGNGPRCPWSEGLETVPGVGCPVRGAAFPVGSVQRNQAEGVFGRKDREPCKVLGSWRRPSNVYQSRTTAGASLRVGLVLLTS